MTINVLVTDWGEFNCPPDLEKLWDAAPKVVQEYINEDGEPSQRIIPDRTTAAGSAFYAREREILSAVNVIYSTETMEVVNVNSA